MKIRGQTGEFPIFNTRIRIGNREFTRLTPNFTLQFLQAGGPAFRSSRVPQPLQRR